ncbi:GYDIA family GHMP kinase [Spongiimicrobium sp. 3-5]|uniref:GYDIA family GHMP kinase n=1 Tax=Spongiimicrobium sp. 3-5 TaxID=3332596 RepID=UPI00397EF423
MNQEFYSSGKLLLTGEYVVLDGAIGLAIPTKYGQSLQVNEITEPKLVWKSYDHQGKVWFEHVFNLPLVEHLNMVDTDTEFTTIINTLYKILKEATVQNPRFLFGEGGYSVKTNLNFPRDWGLGTSSTLINNIAQWAKIDAYGLLWKSFGGSGYDIACAQAKGSISYQLKNGVPIAKEIHFSPSFTDRFYFVYLNKKQNSKEGIASYRASAIDKEKVIKEISLISQKILVCDQMYDLELLLQQHEHAIARILGVSSIKESLFPDFKGAVKSLGAWGGDFIWAIGGEKTPAYFNAKGFDVVIPYSKMIL